MKCSTAGDVPALSITLPRGGGGGGLLETAGCGYQILLPLSRTQALTPIQMATAATESYPWWPDILVGPPTLPRHHLWAAKPGSRTSSGEPFCCTSASLDGGHLFCRRC